MARFFITDANMRDNTIEITGQDAIHISTVLRGKKGDVLTACDHNGTEYVCRISEIGSKSVLLEIMEQKTSLSEPGVKVTLFQGMPKADKMELIIQKCVELGVHRIVPVFTENTVVKITDKTLQKTERFQKISESAAKQCGRGMIPFIHPPVSFVQALQDMSRLDMSFIAYEGEKKRHIKDLTKDFKGKTAGIFIGPEGGFSPKEIEQCLVQNIHSVSLGHRILRTETAGFTALTIFLYEMGEL